MFCNQCNANNADDANFCQQCGKRLGTTGLDKSTLLSSSPVYVSTHGSTSSLRNAYRMIESGTPPPPPPPDVLTGGSAPPLERRLEDQQLNTFDLTEDEDRLCTSEGSGEEFCHEVFIDGGYFDEHGTLQGALDFKATLLV